MEIVINSNDDISSSDNDSLHQENIEDLPDSGELMSVLNSGIRENLFTTRVYLPIEDDHSPLLAYVGWNRHALYNNGDGDDVNYTIAITPVLSTKEPDNSLSMRDEHLDTISTTKSDEVIKSSVEDLVLIPSEPEGIPDTMCDVHLVNNPTPLEAKDHFEIVINSNDDFSSSEDDSLYNENIEYVEASPHDSELVSLEIKALKDNPTPSSEFLTKSSSTSPKSFLEETNTFDNSLPEFENFCFDLEEISSGKISSGSTTTYSDISLSDYDSFIFDLSNDQFPPTDMSDLIMRSSLMNSFTSYLHWIEDDHSHLLAYVLWIFLAYLTYLVIPPYLYSFENEDTIFDPGIAINRFYSFKPGLFHRCGTFKKLNTHRSHLNESPTEMLFSTCFLMDQ
nr:hypothetical protein [Tanacetum cinerariifolium]